MAKFIEVEPFAYKITYKQINLVDSENAREILIIAKNERKAQDIFWSECRGEEDVITVMKIELIDTGIWIDKDSLKNSHEYGY